MVRFVIPCWCLLAACDLGPDPEGLVASSPDDVIVPGTPGEPASRQRVAVQPRRAAARPPADSEGVAAEDTAAEVPEEGERVVIDTPGLSPLLGRDLAETASGMQRYDTKMGEGAGLAARGDTLAHSGGKVEAIEIAKPSGHRPPPGAITGNPASWPSLSMPRAKACLAGAAAEVTEAGSTQSGGLTSAAFRAGINGVATRAYACFPSSTTGTVRASAWVTAGCDGRASRVEVESDQSLPDAVIACIEHTLQHASFPAHGLPSGQEALVPLTFRL